MLFIRRTKLATREQSLLFLQIVQITTETTFSDQASELRGTLERKGAEFKIKQKEMRTRIHEMDRLLATIEARILQI